MRTFTLRTGSAPLTQLADAQQTLLDNYTIDLTGIRSGARDFTFTGTIGKNPVIVFSPAVQEGMPVSLTTSWYGSVMPVSFIDVLLTSGNMVVLYGRCSRHLRVFRNPKPCARNQHRAGLADVIPARTAPRCVSDDGSGQRPARLHLDLGQPWRFDLECEHANSSYPVRCRLGHLHVSVDRHRCERSNFRIDRFRLVLRSLITLPRSHAQEHKVLRGRCRSRHPDEVPPSGRR